MNASIFFSSPVTWKVYDFCVESTTRARKISAILSASGPVLLRRIDLDEAHLALDELLVGEIGDLDDIDKLVELLEDLFPGSVHRRSSRSSSGRR